MAAVPPVLISAIPPFPALSDRALGTYNSKAYAFGTHMGTTFDTEFNASVTNVAANATVSFDSAAAAVTALGLTVAARDAAIAAAASAISAPGTNSTSTSSLTLSLGVKNLVTQAGKTYPTGANIVIARTSSPTTQMGAIVNTYDNATGAMTATVNTFVGSGTYTDWTISIGLSAGGALPAISGADVGKLLGVVAGPVFGLVASRGADGAAIGGNQTLVVASAGVQQITPTASGQWVQLPVETTVPTGLGLFSLQNLGSWDVEIRNSVGAAIGYIGSGATVGVSLRATTTSGWVLQGALPLGVHAADVNFALSLGSSTSGQLWQVVALDSTRDLLIYSGDARVYAQVWDSTAAVFGTPVLVRTANVSGRVRAIKSATDQVLCLSFDNAQNLQAVVLSVSGTTITVNTAVTAASSGASSDNNFHDLVAVAGQGFVFATWTPVDNTAYIRCVTVSGVTPTFGAAATISSSTISAQAPISLFDAGSSRVVVFVPDSSTLTIRPYTIAAGVLTAGTSVAPTTASANYMVRTLASGRWAVVGLTGTAATGRIVTLTGTVVTQTSIGLTATASSMLAAAHVVGSQVIVAYLTSTGACVNVLTDNAGTAVAGTEISQTVTFNMTATCAFDASSLSLYQGAQTGMSGRVAQFGISGNNPVLMGARSQASTLVAEGGIPLPSTIAQGKHPVQNGVLRGASGASVAALQTASPLMWYSAKALPAMVLSPVRMATYGAIDPSRFRSASLDAEWVSVNVVGGTQLNVQRLKVA